MTCPRTQAPVVPALARTKLKSLRNASLGRKRNRAPSDREAERGAGLHGVPAPHDLMRGRQPEAPEKLLLGQRISYFSGKEVE